MKNVEIKARYGNLEQGKTIADKLKAKFMGNDHQIDTYFKFQDQRVKLRESSLSGPQLVAYKRPDEKGPKLSQYQISNVSDPEKLKDLFKHAVGIQNCVDKNRAVFIKDNVRIHLDDVKELGTFIEFEAVFQDQDDTQDAVQKLHDLMKEFGIGSEDLLTGSYSEILKSQIPKQE